MSLEFERNSQCSASEDPWDGSKVTGSGAMVRRVSVGPMVWLVVCATLTILLLATASSVKAQERVAPVVEPDPPRLQASLLLNRGELEAAGDYLKLLVEVRELAEDYRDYFSRLEGKLAEKNATRLSKLVNQLSDGRYASDYERLGEDLAILQEKLTYPSETRDAADSERKVLRLSESLRREIEFLREQLLEEIELKIQFENDSIHSSEDIRLYVTSCVAEAQLDIREVQQNIGLLRVDLEAAAVMEMAEASLSQVQIAVMLDELYPMCSVAIAEMPEMPEIPNYVVTTEGDTRIIHVTPSLDHGGVVVTHQMTGSREIVDSMVLSAKGMPVVITNASGSISATGWDRPVVMVRSEVTVSSGTPGETQKLLDNVKVELHTKDGRVFVETALPRLDDPDVQILDSRIEIKAPATSPLVIENSFGPTTVSHFANGMKIKTDFSEVRLSTIKGTTEVVSRMGSLYLKGVNGDVKLKGSYTPITLKSCGGEFEIDNELSPIILHDTRGNVRLRNSDQIFISDHTGRLDIENSNGLLEVRGLTGDLVARNEYQPIFVEDVDGSVELNNVRSTIETNSIRGSLKADAAGGTILVHSPQGPIYLSGSGGDIVVTLTDPLRGPSSIVSTAGNIQLQLSEQSDIALTTLTTGGMINSSFPIKVERDGQSSQALLQIGRAANSLKVSGQNSNIDLSMLK